MGRRAPKSLPAPTPTTSRSVDDFSSAPPRLVRAPARRRRDAMASRARRNFKGPRRELEQREKLPTNLHDVWDACAEFAVDAREAHFAYLALRDRGLAAAAADVDDELLAPPRASAAASACRNAAAEQRLARASGVSAKRRVAARSIFEEHLRQAVLRQGGASGSPLRAPASVVYSSAT